MQGPRQHEPGFCMCNLYGIALENDIQNDIQMQNARFVQFWNCMCNLYGRQRARPGSPRLLTIRQSSAVGMSVVRVAARPHVSPSS